MARGRKATRADDERILGWLARRRAGERVAQIAASSGVTNAAIYGATGLIRKADEAYTGRDLEKDY